MRVRRLFCIASLLAGTLPALGCNEKAGMRNMVPGTGPNQQLELKLKKGSKPLPSEPPSPKAPP
jgi:hypothetical protein